MKSILLTSTALVAFAGAAAAEITFGGEATLGNNDTINLAAGETESGFYWDATVTVTMSQELDNGLTASATFDIDVIDTGLGLDLESGGYVLSLTSDTAGIFFGDTEHAAITHWADAGSMDADNFNEVDGETVLRGDITFGGVDASVSYAYNYTLDELDAMSVGLSGTFGSVTVSAAYQEDAPAGAGITGHEVFGISAGMSFAGADVTVAYASNTTTGEDSTGIAVAYPVGPVTLEASYVMESVDAGTTEDNWDISAAYAAGAVSVTVATDESEDWSIEGSYDVGNGLMVYAGLADGGEDTYIAGTYDLGGGASILVSYADDADLDNSDDEVGDPEYQVGTTVEISFEF